MLVDTHVLVDVLENDPDWADGSIAQLRAQSRVHRQEINPIEVLKNRLNREGSESVTKCNRLKLEASDGKRYLTDVASDEIRLRLIQSVPSPKAEP